jgi:hypothetical protein
MKQLESPHMLPDDKPPPTKSERLSLSGQVLENTARIVVIESEVQELWKRIPYRGIERVLLLGIFVVLCLILWSLVDLVHVARLLLPR